ncbi:myo-inosose-2 dehydratase [Propionivibrio soli]|uniref:myo-inosose-2 dehydratase n=1 Tax=Propionivibrio soli TaxID=2976531 RepID=UPI0021E95B47|nr:myo-inosose-2 dehydratase [Propionivibrio soli]
MGKLSVRIGINPISWTNDDLPQLGGNTPLETCLSEGTEIGYTGFELGNKFPKDPAELKSKLAGYGAVVVSGWYSGNLAEGTLKDEIEAVGPHLKKLVYNGCKVMVYGEVAGSVQGQQQTPLSRRPKFENLDQWKAYAEKLDAFGAYLKSNGITLAYHHHMGAYCESPQDLDTLIKLTTPNVGLLFDTGHITFAGGDALAELRKHIGRVVHVHCKDVRKAVMQKARNNDQSFLNSVLDGVFTVPGDGMIDFEPILSLLADHNYSGWLVVEAEQDPAVAPSYEYAKKGFDYLTALVAKINGK